MKSVLITGANRGLGLELLKVYHSQSFYTYPVVRTMESSEQIKEQFPMNCTPIVADLLDDESRERIKNILSDSTESLDIVINNAGISGSEYVLETVMTEEVNRLFNIHCLGPMRTIQACLPYLRRSSNPRIVNVSSRLGSLTRMATGEFKDRGFSYSYRMAKAAQNMFTICLGQELERDNITVCAVHPGQLLTRGRSTDADMEPAMAAMNMFDWIEIMDMSSSGKFVQPLVQDMSW